MCEYHRVLLREGTRFGWGLILIHRKPFFNFIEGLLKRFGKIKVLEIGAWKCMLGQTLKERYGDKIEYVGVDVVDLPDRLSPGQFYIMSGDSLLFPSNSFHAIVLLETLEHIPDYVKALYECYRVLRPKGGIFIQSVKCTSPNATVDPSHYHVLHPETLERLLKWIGFRDIQYIDKDNFAIWGYK